MSKVIVIASRPGVGKSSLGYKIFQERLKNKQKGFFLSLERNKKDSLQIVGKEYEDYIFDDEQEFLKILDRNKNINFLILDYFQLFDKEKIKDFLEKIKNKNIDLYILSQLRERLSLNQKPEICHLDSYLKKIANKVIFLYISEGSIRNFVLVQLK